jgi:hypothetical protein
MTGTSCTGCHRHTLQLWMHLPLLSFSLLCQHVCCHPVTQPRHTAAPVTSIVTAGPHGLEDPHMRSDQCSWITCTCCCLLLTNMVSLHVPYKRCGETDTMMSMQHHMTEESLLLLLLLLLQEKQQGRGKAGKPSNRRQRGMRKLQTNVRTCCEGERKLGELLGSRGRERNDQVTELMT